MAIAFFSNSTVYDIEVRDGYGTLIEHHFSLNMISSTWLSTDAC